MKPRTRAEHLLTKANSTQAAVIKAIALEARASAAIDAGSQRTHWICTGCGKTVCGEHECEDFTNYHGVPIKIVASPPPKKKRKQAGREETQVHRDVRGMIRKAWSLVTIEEEHRFQLCEGHSYTVDFKLKTAATEEIWVEAKGAHCWEDSRVKFLWCMTQVRWAFFVWAKQHKRKRWTFEVWHSGNRLKMKSKRQNPKSMAECRELIEAESERINEIAGRSE